VPWTSNFTMLSFIHSTHTDADGHRCPHIVLSVVAKALILAGAGLTQLQASPTRTPTSARRLSAAGRRFACKRRTGDAWIVSGTSMTSNSGVRFSFPQHPSQASVIDAGPTSLRQSCIKVRRQDVQHGLTPAVLQDRHRATGSQHHRLD